MRQSHEENSTAKRDRRSPDASTSKLVKTLIKTSLDCIPCLLRQSLDAARLVSTNPSRLECSIFSGNFMKIREATAVDSKLIRNLLLDAFGKEEGSDIQRETPGC